MNLPNNMFLNDQKATEPQTIANLFANHFDSIYERSSTNSSDNKCSMDSSGISSVPLSGLVITIEEILKKLKSLNVLKGPGPDLINSSFITAILWERAILSSFYYFKQIFKF